MLCFVRIAIVVLGLWQGSSAQTCEPIIDDFANKLCVQKFGYNMTSFGDTANTQTDAAIELAQFKPLIKIHWNSSSVSIFFCSVFFPMCYSVTQKGIPPCRSLCLDTRATCLPLMLNFGYSWPHGLNCSLFPVFGSDQLCVAPSQSASPVAMTQSPVQTTVSPAQTTVSPTQTTVNPNVPEVLTTVKKKKGSGKRLRKKVKKCWQGGADRKSKRCCRFGKKAVKMNRRSTCSLPGNVLTKKASERKLRNHCRSDEAKQCYQACCMYMKERKRRKNRKNREKKRRS